MTRFLLVGLGALAAMLLWVVLVFAGFSEGWGRSPLAAEGDPDAFMQAAKQRIESDHTGNLSMLMLERGQVAQRYHFSVGAPVNDATVFQVASLGKWITAWGVMVLVDDGAIDLDAPVSRYLTRWEIPAGDYDRSAVTVRRLLSHTAGLSDGLGYDGFDAEENTQSLEASLTQAADASPGNDGAVTLGAEPGSEWRYSGGGYTLLQLIIEEVSEQSFTEFMTDRVFAPLGMRHSTFDFNAAERFGLAQNFDRAGNTEPFRWYTALAATSLFTSAEDMATFIAAQFGSGNSSVLTPDTLAQIRTPHASQMGADIWGLGAMLFAPNNQGGYIIGHDGSNGPAINAAARFNPATGDGIVILSTGSESLATTLAGEWIFWKTGNIDSLMFLMSVKTMLIVMGVGAVLIMWVSVRFGRRLRRAESAGEKAKETSLHV